MNTLDLAKKLIEFQSTFSNQEQRQEVLNFVHQYVLKNTKCQLLSETIEHNGFHTLIIATKSLKSPALSFYSHLDVVEAPQKCYTPTVTGDRLHGRGAGDMKGPAASLINAFIQIVNDNPDADICLFLPTDEESGGQNCAKYTIEEYGFRTKCVIMPDSGSGLDTLITHQKGIYFLEVIFHGVSAHGSRPWEGSSATQKLFEFNQKLQSRIPKSNPDYFSTANPSMITGGESFNSVAAQAKLTLDIRTASAEDKKQLLEILEDLKEENITYQVNFDDPAFEVSTENQYMQLAKKVTEEVIQKPVKFQKEHGGSDGRFFQKYDIPCIVNGVDKEGSHADHENASIKEIEQLETFCIEFTKQFNNLG